MYSREERTRLTGEINDMSAFIPGAERYFRRSLHVKNCRDRPAYYVEYGIYTTNLLKSVAVNKLQVAILARLSRDMSQTVRID